MLAGNQCPIWAGYSGIAGGIQVNPGLGGARGGSLLHTLASELTERAGGQAQ